MKVREMRFFSRILSHFDTKETAMKKLDMMTPHERTLDLGKRSIGKYGCYSCHNITEFEGRGIYWS